MTTPATASSPSTPAAGGSAAPASPAAAPAGPISHPGVIPGVFPGDFGGDGKPLNKNEQMKLIKDGLDVLDDIIRYSEQGDFDAIDETDLEGRFRWFGIYQQRPKKCGYFMQ